MAGNDTNTVLLLHCDETTFADTAVGATATHTATVSGDATTTATNAKFSNALICTQAGAGFLSYPSQADFNLGAAGSGNDWTIDFWAYLTARNSVAAQVTFLGPNNNGASGWQLVSTATNFTLAPSGGSIAYAFPLTTLTHIAVVKSGTTVTLYAGGTSQGTYTDFDMNNDAMNFMVNSADQAGTFPSQLTIDEIRLSKGLARWTANFTPPTAAYSAASIRSRMLMGIGL